MEQDYFEANPQARNLRTGVHKDAAFYDAAGFLAGKSSLNTIELQELGSVAGKSLLHLQCHFGLDTLSPGAGLGPKLQVQTCRMRRQKRPKG